MTNAQICPGHFSETRWILGPNSRESNLLHKFDAGLLEIDDDYESWAEDYTKLFLEGDGEKLPNFFRVQLLHS
jgi:hypothetical protein